MDRIKTDIIANRIKLHRKHLQMAVDLILDNRYSEDYAFLKSQAHNFLGLIENLEEYGKLEYGSNHPDN